MRNSRPALLIIALGALTFVTVFSFLQLAPTPSRAESSSPGAEPTATPVVAVATGSLAPRITEGDLAVGVPVAGSEALLRNVQGGDRLDILASVASPTDGQPLTAVLVHGATVLQPLNGSDPLLVEVAAPDALMVAHLVLSGTHLSYLLWPASGAPPDSSSTLDGQAVRSALGLVATPSATAVMVVSTPVVNASPTPQPRPGSGFLYQVQPDDTWERIATTFGVPVDQLRQWNEAAPADNPVPGSLVFIPRGS
jgi:hypothetical protein